MRRFFTQISARTIKNSPISIAKHISYVALYKLNFLLAFLIFTGNIGNAQYCIPTATTNDATGITFVSFNTISQTSSGAPAYTDNSGITTYVETGQIHDLSVRVNTEGEFTVYVYAWIDWDNDGDFSNETIIDLGSVYDVVDGAPSASPQSITIPNVADGPYRMRIRTRFNSAPTPCGNNNYSEAEDYTIYVGAPPTCPAPSGLLATNIGLNSADLNWTENGTATQWQIEYGATPYTPDGVPDETVTGKPFNLGGLSPNTQYAYYVRADCGGGDYSNWAGPFLFSTVSLGSTCEAPITITSLPYNTTDNTGNYGNNYSGSPGSSGCGTTSSYLSGDEVVYAYTADFNGCINITMSPTATWSGIFIYGDCEDIGTNCLAGVANSGTAPRVINNFAVSNGQTYYFLISTFAAPQTTGYTLDIEACPTDEMDWVNLQWPVAEAIEVGGSIDVYTQGYEPGITPGAGAGTGIVVWIGISNEGAATSSDPSTWSTWIPATYNVDVGNNDEFSASIGSSLVPGTYRYASRWQLNGGPYVYGGYNAGGGGFWDGINNVSGTLTINPLSNDECSGAIAFPALPLDGSCASVTVNTNGATGTPDPTCGGTEDNDLWYSFTVPVGYTTVFYTNNNISGNTDRIHQLFTTCGNHVSCHDPESGSFTGLTGGETYILRTYTWSAGTNSEYSICLSVPPPPPANDECADAIAFPAIPLDGSCASVTVNTNGATGTADPTCTGTEDNDLWYSFTVPVGYTTVFYTNNNISGNTDRVHQLFTTCGNHVSCHDLESGSFTGLTGGETYILRTYTWGAGTNSEYSICLSVPPPPPANDECIDAIAFPAIPLDGSCASVTVNTNGATGTADPTCTGTEDNDLWYSFTVPVGYTTVLYTNNNISGNTNRVHQLFTTCGNHVSCHDPESGSFTGLTGGETYILRTYTFGAGTNSEYSICLSVPPPPPANDECTNAISINGGGIPGQPTGAPVNGTTTNATASSGQPACVGTPNDDVWYSFITNGSGGDVTVTVVSNSGFDAVVQLLDACGGASLECVDNTASGGTEVLNASGLSPNTQYFIRVYHYFSGSGTGGFTIAVDGAALPIELISFNARAEGKVNVITWETASEINNDYQMIERRSDQKSDWSEVGRVNASNGDRSIRSYSIIDNSPLPVSYYRLRSVDLDGSVQYSKAVSVYRSDVSYNTAIERLYPVPARSILNIEFTSRDEEMLTISVMDITGRIITDYKITSKTGFNIESLDVSNLAAGTYIISMKGSTSNEVKKFVKQ